MLLTEKEAREKWCPRTRRPHQMKNEWGSTIGTSGLSRENCCLGFGCAWWCWDAKLNDQLLNDAKQAWEENADYERPQRPAFRDSAEWQEANAARLGFCGLAGKAESDEQD